MLSRSFTLRALALMGIALSLSLAGCYTKGHARKRGKPLTRPAATQPATRAAADGWKDLFDGKTLKGWKTSGFGGEGEPEITDGLLIVNSGEDLSGVTYTGDDLPTMNYEIVVVAKKVQGNDFFCGLTFPVNKAHASMICGGWGGTVVGISSIDDNDAANNDTTQFQKFEPDKWYTIRVRVTPDRLQTWIDDQQMADVDTKGKKIDIRSGIEQATPLGLSTYRTTSAFKSVKIRRL
jgi:hypothetical protein